MQAPKFSLPDQAGNVHSLKDYAGKWIVLYFYPKDDTPGCTKEACGFRDNITELQNMGVVVLGVSKDNVTSHKKFAEKYHLNFPLLSDESKETIKAYESWGQKKFMGRTFDGVLRNTYIIDPEGNIKKKYEKVNPTIHAQQIIDDIKAFTS